MLKDFLLEHKDEIFKRETPHLWVEGILVFTNPNASLDLKNPTIHILEMEDLPEFIESSESETEYSPKEVDAMGRVLLKYASP